MRSMKIDKLDSWLPVTHKSYGVTSLKLDSWLPVTHWVRKRRKNKIKRILSWLFR